MHLPSLLSKLFAFDKTREGVNQKFALWRSTLKVSVLTLSRRQNVCTVKYSHHKKSEVEVRLHKFAVHKCRQFRYLDSKSFENGNIDEDVT